MRHLHTHTDACMCAFYCKELLLITDKIVSKITQPTDWWFATTSCFEQVLVVCFTVFGGLMAFNYNRVLQVWAIPLLLVAFFAYLVAHSFLSVFETVLDALFLCFAADLETNDGSAEKPYFMDQEFLVSKHFISCFNLHLHSRHCGRLTAGGGSHPALEGSGSVCPLPHMSWGWGVGCISQRWDPVSLRETFSLQRHEAQQLTLTQRPEVDAVLALWPCGDFTVALFLRHFCIPSIILGNTYLITSCARMDSTAILRPFVNQGTTVLSRTCCLEIAGSCFQQLWQHSCCSFALSFADRDILTAERRLSSLSMVWVKCHFNNFLSFYCHRT